MSVARDLVTVMMGDGHMSRAMQPTSLVPPDFLYHDYLGHVQAQASPDEVPSSPAKSSMAPPRIPASDGHDGALARGIRWRRERSARILPRAMHGRCGCTESCIIDRTERLRAKHQRRAARSIGGHGASGSGAKPDFDTRDGLGAKI